MNRKAELEQRKQALVLRCEGQRRDLARETARWLAWLQRAESAAHAVRGLLSHPLVPMVLAVLAAGAGGRILGRWALRIRSLGRTVRLLGTLMAAARFAPVVLAILRSRRVG